MLEFKEVSKGESSRTYIFSGGNVKIENVLRLAVGTSGTHRLETAGGGKFIVAPGWLAIEIIASEWSF